MTAILDTEPDPQLAAHLIAGRRAALGVLVANSPAGSTYEGLEPEDLTPERCSIVVNGYDIGPGIDAAVIETVVRLQHSEDPVRQRRPWWRLW